MDGTVNTAIGSGQGQLGKKIALQRSCLTRLKVPKLFRKLAARVKAIQIGLSRISPDQRLLQDARVHTRTIAYRSEVFNWSGSLNRVKQQSHATSRTEYQKTVR